MRIGHFVFVLLLATVVQVPGQALDSQDGEIILNMFVNYGSAYRDGSWVPVDVLVMNDDFDVSGWVEVRTYSAANAVQSPIYRVPAESPKGSRKRFRLHCRLEQTARIEAMLYHRNRPVLEIPAWMGVRPINPEDLLGLVLDEEPEHFGFLHTVAGLEDRERGFHREALRNVELPFLADHPQCYESIDMIIMGDIEPDRISLRHRALLHKYVADGGVLAVCTGAHGYQYRGTWVERLLGVELGPQHITNERELARAVFPEEARAGANSSEQCAVTELIRRNGRVQTFGTNRVLLALNPVGRGFVATIAVDATSHALQRCIGYQSMWHDLCALRYRRGQLNVRAASQVCIRHLPRLTGVKIQPRSSVLTYLLLYFGIAIVANWIVCSILKRRELAWVLLIFLSVGFTAYAMVFGTAGRAKASDLEQVEVLHVPEGGGMAELHAIVGVLTARTSRYSMGLTREFALAGDVSLLHLPSMYDPRVSRRRVTGMLRPFYLIQEARPRIENLAVGASEMRLIQVESDVPVEGGVEGRIVLDETGLNGVLVNNTGFNIRIPYLVFNGEIHPVAKTPDGWNVAVPRARLRRTAGFRVGSWRSGRGSSLDMFKNEFLMHLFSETEYMSGLGAGFGPYLCGWTAGPCIGSVMMDTPINKRIGETLIVADIEVERGETVTTTWSELTIRVNGAVRQSWVTTGGREYEYYPIYAGTSPVVDVLLPRRLVNMTPSEIILDLYWHAGQGAALIFVPEGAAASWSDEHAVETTVEQHDGTRVSKTTYRIDDWRSYYDETSGCLSGNVESRAHAPTAQRSFGDFTVCARAILPGTYQDRGGLSPWR